MRNNYFYIILFISSLVLGQSPVTKTISGQILVNSNEGIAEYITIKNSSTNQTTVSDISGKFSIIAQVDDNIIFSAINLETTQTTITPKDFEAGFITLTMQQKTEILDEVIINENSQITAENLGIIPKGQKKYTPSERKIYTATSTPGDALLNAISGRTKMLKKELVNEKKIRHLNQLQVLFDENFYTNKLLIPKDYIKGFQYYCIENAEFIRTLETKNKNMSSFVMTELAQNYLKILSNEN